MIPINTYCHESKDPIQIIIWFIKGNSPKETLKEGYKIDVPIKKLINCL